MPKRADAAKGRIGMAGVSQRKPFARSQPRTFFHLIKGNPFSGVRRET